jgi:hypothetical protein
MAQHETEALVQNLQTANFDNLLSFWDNQVEVNMPDLAGQKQFNAKESNEVLKTFFNKNSVLGFEKSAARQVGTTIYLTGKLILKGYLSENSNEIDISEKEMGIYLLKINGQSFKIMKN